MFDELAIVARVSDQTQGEEAKTRGSKAGLEMLVKIYAGEVAKTRVRANLIDPDIVRTRLRARAFPGEDPAALPSPESVAGAFLALALPECTRNGQVVMASAISLRPNE